MNGDQSKIIYQSTRMNSWWNFYTRTRAHMHICIYNTKEKVTRDSENRLQLRQFIWIISSFPLYSLSRMCVCKYTLFEMFRKYRRWTIREKERHISEAMQIPYAITCTFGCTCAYNCIFIEILQAICLQKVMLQLHLHPDNW